MAVLFYVCVIASLFLLSVEKCIAALPYSIGLGHLVYQGRAAAA